MTSSTRGPAAPILERDGVRFRDLNKNGRLDPYEHPGLPVEQRVRDLLGRMTLEEKAGLLFHTVIGVGEDGTLLEAADGFHTAPTSELVGQRLLNHFNVHRTPAPALAAEWHNRLQELAERTRLGIPVTVSSDPRHGFSDNPASSAGAGWFSRWPEPIGFGAIGDEELVRHFGDIGRQEYLALGIRVALHPMADLATEPRWARISGTFGEDAELAGRLVAAYVLGFQGGTLGPQSVACMTKHFPGGGPQRDGEDPHFPYGREQVYPGGNFEYHLRPFEAAFRAKTAQIMPYYGMPMGTELEEVGFGFNRDVITGLLRERYGFDGVVCTDWALLSDTEAMGERMAARAWGVEELSREERALKALGAGVDQFGGEFCTDLVIDLVRTGRLEEPRLDVSARRLLRDKFRLGLFDDPYVPVEAARATVGRPDFRAAGDQAQRRAVVLLTNPRALLPLRGRPRLYVEGVDQSVASTYGEVASSPEAADLGLVRLTAPYQPRPGLLERFFHAGDLDFDAEVLTRLLELQRRVPTIVVVHLDRPAVLTELTGQSAALLGEFGASDEAVLDVLFGRFAPEAKLPFELPSSMDAVRGQLPDVPHDSRDPLFAFGHGLRYG
jgi:beta-glucosidase